MDRGIVHKVARRYITIFIKSSKTGMLELDFLGICGII